MLEILGCYCCGLSRSWKNSSYKSGCCLKRSISEKRISSLRNRKVKGSSFGIVRRIGRFFKLLNFRKIIRIRIG